MDGFVVEEAAAGSGEAFAGGGWVCGWKGRKGHKRRKGRKGRLGEAEAICGGFFVAAYDNNGAAAHVFGLADYLLEALVFEVVERFGWVFQEAWFRRGLAGRHGGREIDEPAGLYGEAAHDFQGGGGVFCSDHYVAGMAGGDDALAEDVGGVQEV